MLGQDPVDPATPRPPTASDLIMRATRGERERAVEGEYAPGEKKKIAAQAKKHKVPLEMVEKAIEDRKRDHPRTAGWGPLTFKRIAKVTKTRGRPPKIDYEYEQIPYGFNKSPDGKNLKPGSQAYKDRTRAMAALMYEEVFAVFRRAQNGDENAKNIIAQAGWYRAMRARLRAEFGGVGDLFADLLGATSPNTPVRENWNNAIDVLRRAMRGDFDDQIEQWEAWVEETDTLERELQSWVNQQKLVPGATVASIKRMPEYETLRTALFDARKRISDILPHKEAKEDGSAAKYGINGKNVIKATVDLWRVVRNANTDLNIGGTRPKAINFSGNLIGFKTGATIDVWAARLLQRIAGMMRIPSAAESTVTGYMLEDGTTTLQFGFGQEVFKEAVALIRGDETLSENKVFAEINDDDLQAVVWFIEKELWTANGWTSKEGEGGSFEFEANLTGVADQERVTALRKIVNAGASTPEQKAEAIAEIESLERVPDRFIAGLSIQQSSDLQGKPFVPVDADMAALSNRLRLAIYEADDGNTVLVGKAVSTEGRYGDVERSVDLEVVTREGYDPRPLWRQILTEGQGANQDSVFLSRVLRTEEEFDPLVHRPGVEIYFREAADRAKLESILAELADPLNVTRPWRARKDAHVGKALRKWDKKNPDQLKSDARKDFENETANAWEADNPSPAEVWQEQRNAQPKEDRAAWEAANPNPVGAEFLTVVVDGRRLASSMAGQMPAAVGVRLQYIPEFEQRYGMDDLSELDDEALAIKVKEKAKELAALSERLAGSVEGVSFGGQFWYETETAFSSEYQEKIDALTTGVSERTIGNIGGPQWTGQSIRAGIESANRHVRETSRGEPGVGVLGGIEGAEDAPTNETLSQPKAPIFYSALSRFIENSKVTKASAAEWKQMLVQPARTVRSAQRDPATNRVVLGEDGKPIMLERTVPEVLPTGVTPEEIEMSGVMDWLDLQQGPVTREALAAFVAANGVTVEEVVKGGVGGETEEYQRQLLRVIEMRDQTSREINVIRQRHLGRRVTDEDDVAELEYLENELDRLQNQIDGLENSRGSNERNSGTKWSSWTLPGGENYTELLLRLPTEIKAKQNWRVRRGDNMSAGLFSTEAEAQAWIDQNGTTPGFLRIEREPDSQLETGYRSSHWSELNVLAHVRFKERIGPNGERVLALEEVQSDWHKEGRERGYQWLTKEEARKQYKEIGGATGRSAAFDRVEELIYEEWPTISQTIKGIEYEGQNLPDPGAVVSDLHGQRLASYSPALLDAFAEYNKFIELSNLSEGNRRVPNAPFKNNAWVDLVLKRMIRYAAENKFDSVAWIPGNIQNGKIVEETDDNRADFYDKIVPNAANKLGKKYGARVETTEVPHRYVAERYMAGIGRWSEVAAGDTEQEATDRAGGKDDGLKIRVEAHKFHSLPITPELREAALNEGFPLFQPRKFNPPGHGAVAPPADIPPVRLDLKLVKDLYGEEAVRKLPAAVRQRSSTSSNVSDIIQQIEAVRKVLSVKRKGPQTLTQFIMQRQVKQQDGTKRNRQWGIKGADGELRAMGLERLINNKSGMTLDAMRELAEEAGFIRAETGGARATEYGDFDATPNDLLDALAREAKGEAVVRIGEEVDNKELDDAKTWASWLEQNGVDIYEASPKKLRASVDAMLRDTDESLVSPDKAAEMFGFANGEELLKALAEVGNRDQYLNKMADQKMVEEFGDMMSDGTLQAEAAEAARLDIAHRQTEIELEALSRAVGQQASTNYAKSLARDIIAMRTVKEIAAYERDLNNERQFGKQALRLVEKGDYPAALKAKQRQLVSMQLYIEGKKASEKIEKRRQDLLKYYTSEGRRDKIAGDYMEKIEAVLDDFELRVSKQGPKEQRTRNSAAEYVAAMTLQGREAEIAPEAMLLASLNEKMVWRNMTAAEVENLVGTIQNLAHLGRTKDGLMKAAEKRKFRAVVSTLVERLRAAPSYKDRSVPFSPTLSDKGFAVLRYWDSKWAKIEDQMALLDGSSAGPLVDTLVQPFAEADAREGIMLTELTRQLRGLHKTLTERENRQLVGRRVSTPELALPGNRKMTMMDVLVVGLNWGNDGNRQALMDGYGWTAEAVEAVLNRYLTDSHWNFIEGAWGIVEGLKPEAFAVEKRVTGVEPKAVEGITFTLASGRKIEGKYFPLKYDGAQAGAISARHGRKEEADLLKEIGMSFTKPMTRTGHTIERVGSGGKPVKIAIETLFHHLENVVHDITHREALIDAVRIIKDPAFIEAYQNAAGLEQYNRLMPWLTDIATKNGARDRGMFAGVMSHLRAGTSATLMGFKFGTAIQQFTGWAEAVPEIGLDWVLRGMVKTYAGGPITFFQQWQFVNSKSDYLMTRLQFGKHRDVRAQTTKVGDRTPLREIQDNQFMFLSGLDAFIGTSVWVSSYDKAMAGKAKDIAAGDEEAAVAFADRIVRFSLSSSETYALPEMMRGSEMDKWLTAIYTYGAKQYNRTRTKVYQVRYGQIGVPEFTAAMFVMHAVLPIMAAFLAARLLPDDDEEEEVLLENAGTEVMMNLAGMFPLFRDVVGTFIKPEFGYQMSPVEGSMEKVIGATRRAAEGESLESEAGAKELVFALGVVLKLPGTQLWVTGEYAYDVATGAEDPLEDPVDAVSEGLIRNTR